jgi:hypothetical protein
MYVFNQNDLPRNYLLTSDSPWLRTGTVWTLKCFLLYYASYIHINLTPESLYLLKKYRIKIPHFKDLSMQIAGSGFVLYFVMIMIPSKLIIVSNDDVKRMKCLWNNHHQPINVTTARAQAFLMDYI